MLAPDVLLAVASRALLGCSSSFRLTRARWVVAWALRERGLSTPEIGRIVGRHHSTILHALAQVGALKGEEAAAFLAAVQAVKAQLGELPTPSAPPDELNLTVAEAAALARDEAVLRPAFPARTSYALRVEGELAGRVEVLASQGRPPAVAWRLASLDPKALARALDRR